MVKEHGRKEEEDIKLYVPEEEKIRKKERNIIKETRMRDRSRRIVIQ
jgi:hypothetical protein